MKKAIVFLLAICTILALFSGCNNITETDTYNTQELLSKNFSSKPFIDIQETSSPLNSNDLTALISNIPREKYESYPDLHNIPLTATLYKDGQTISIDAKDERLIRLMNFYNNSVFYNQYSYTQGLLSIDYIEESVLSEDFRLVLTFTTNTESDTIEYDTNILAYDTFIITDDLVVLIAHDIPGYEGQESKYPYKAVGHTPLHMTYNWLVLFGF